MAQLKTKIQLQVTSPDLKRFKAQAAKVSRLAAALDKETDKLSKMTIALNVEEAKVPEKKPRTRKK